MPLTLVDPRPGKTPNYGIRGTLKVGNRSKTIFESAGVSDKKLARQVLKVREQEIYGELVAELDGTAKLASHTFEEAALGYLEASKAQSTQRDAVLRIRQDGKMGPCLVSYFGARLVKEIDQTAVDEAILEHFAGRAPGTIQRYLIGPLTQVLNWAAKPGRKWCDRPEFEKLDFDDRRKRWASEEECRRLVAAAVATQPCTAKNIREWQQTYFRTLILFLLLTGCRISEALELDWSDVDLATRWAVFHNTKRNKRGQDKPGEDRGIPLHRQLIAALSSLPGDHRTGPVFTTANGKAYKKRDYGGGQIRSAWRGVCNRDGIKDLHVHDTRHTCGTRLTVAGVHEQVRDEILGHRSTASGRRYAHVPRQPLLDAIDSLPEITPTPPVENPWPARYA